MAHGLRRTAFDQASYEFWGKQFGVINVKDFGALGDGVHDDTAAMQRAIKSAGESGVVVFPPGTYLCSDPLVPLSMQTLVFAAGCQFQPTRDTTLWYFNGVFQVTLQGPLQIQDPGQLTQNTACAVFDNGCRYIWVEKIWGNQVATLLNLRDINASHFVSINGAAIRDNGVILSDNTDANICNVHDNTFDSVMITGPTTGIGTQGTGLLYNAETLGTVGGNHWGRLTVLSMDNGIYVGGAGSHEEWFDTAILDSCSVAWYTAATTSRWFIGNLWMSNGGVGLENGQAAGGSVSDVQIANCVARDNSGTALHNAWIGEGTGMQFGSCSLLNNGGYGLHTPQGGSFYAPMQFGSLAAVGNTAGDLNLNIGGAGSSEQSVSIGNLQTTHANAVDDISGESLRPPALAVASIPTSVALAGPTAGTVYWSWLANSRALRMVLVFTGYENDTATDQTIGFPLSQFAFTPAISVNTTGLTLSASSTALTITTPDSTTTYSGVVEIVGM